MEQSGDGHDEYESGSTGSSPSRYYTPMTHRSRSPVEEFAPPYPAPPSPAPAPQATPAHGSSYPQQNLLHTRPLPTQEPHPQHPPQLDLSPALQPAAPALPSHFAAQSLPSHSAPLTAADLSHFPLPPPRGPIPPPAAAYPQQNLLHARPLSPPPRQPPWLANAHFAPPAPAPIPHTGARPPPNYPPPPYHMAPALYMHDHQLRALRTDISVLRGHAARNEQRLMELHARYQGMAGMEGRLGELVRDVGALVEDVGGRVEELGGEMREARRETDREREMSREREMDRERERERARETNGEREREDEERYEDGERRGEEEEDEDEEPDRWLIPFVRDNKQREWEEIWEREDREEGERTRRRGRTWEEVWEMEDEEEGERMRARAMETL